MFFKIAMSTSFRSTTIRNWSVQCVQLSQPDPIPNLKVNLEVGWKFSLRG